MTDISNSLLMGSLVLGQPVVVLENFLFFRQLGWPMPFELTLSVLKVSFLLASVGLVLYNLQFMVLEDFSFYAVGALMLLMGLGAGAMLVGLQFAVDQNPPLFYDPLIAGFFYIGSLMLFNIVGMTGLLLSVFKGAAVHAVQQWSAIIFFSAPVLVFFTRIVLLVPGPINLFALPFILPSLLLLGQYYLRGCGYPVRSRINGLLIMDAEREVVIGGYRPFGDPKELTMEGMALMASQAILKEAIGFSDHLRSNNFVYLQSGRYVILVILSDGGEKIGRFCAKRLINGFKSKPHLEPEPFCRLLHRSFFPFFDCEAPTEDRVFIQTAI